MADSAELAFRERVLRLQRDLDVPLSPLYRVRAPRVVLRVEDLERIAEDLRQLHLLADEES